MKERAKTIEDNTRMLAEKQLMVQENEWMIQEKKTHTRKLVHIRTSACAVLSHTS
jgi:hypothetical protein